MRCMWRKRVGFKWVVGKQVRAPRCIYMLYVLLGMNRCQYDEWKGTLVCYCKDCLVFTLRSERKLPCQSAHQPHVRCTFSFCHLISLPTSTLTLPLDLTTGARQL